MRRRFAGLDGLAIAFYAVAFVVMPSGPWYRRMLAVVMVVLAVVVAQEGNRRG